MRFTPPPLLKELIRKCFPSGSHGNVYPKVGTQFYRATIKTCQLIHHTVWYPASIASKKKKNLAKNKRVRKWASRTASNPFLLVFFLFILLPFDSQVLLKNSVAVIFFCCINVTRCGHSNWNYINVLLHSAFRLPALFM